MKLGWLVNLSSVHMMDDSSSSWIHLMTIGTYKHPVYGDIEITPDRIKRFAANVNENVRGIELDIDYDHKEYGGEAAGWIKEAQVRTDGLWGLVEWTPKAKELIASRAYKYFSPEFEDTWTHPKTGVEYQDVLCGGGITNRPFLKDILPLNLSESFAFADSPTKGGRTVDPEEVFKQIADLLGLPNDASGDQILGALQVKLGVPGNEDPNDPADPDADSGDAGSGGAPPAQGAEGGQSASGPALSEELKKFTESNPIAKQLMELVTAQGQELSELRKDAETTRVNGIVTRLSDKAKDKGYILPPTTKTALTEALKNAPKQLGEQVSLAFEKLLDVQLAEAGQRGSDRQTQTGTDAVKAFSEAVTKVQKDRSVSYSEAAVIVAKEQPQLFSEYQNSTYAGRE